MLMMMMMQAGRPSPSPPSVFLVTLGFSCWRAAAAQSLPSPCLLHYNVREHSNRRFNGNIMQIVCSAVVPPPPLSIAHEYSFN